MQPWEVPGPWRPPSGAYVVHPPEFEPPPGFLPHPDFGLPPPLHAWLPPPVLQHRQYYGPGLSAHWAVPPAVHGRVRPANTDASSVRLMPTGPATLPALPASPFLGHAPEPASQQGGGAQGAPPAMQLGLPTAERHPGSSCGPAGTSPRRDSSSSAEQAVQPAKCELLRRLKAQLPGLPPALQEPLLRRCIAEHAGSPPPKARAPEAVRVDAVLRACGHLLALSDEAFAALLARRLGELQAAFLAGEALEASPVLLVSQHDVAQGAQSCRPAVEAHALTAALLQALLKPDCLVPRPPLPPRQESTAGTPPPPAAMLAQPPAELASWLADRSAVGALLAAALADLRTAERLGTSAAAGHLHVSADVDYGVQGIVPAPAVQLPAHGDPLAALHALAGGVPAGGCTEAAAGLRFRQLTVRHGSTCKEAAPVWLLGGVATPHYPHTLAALDEARLFWADGRRAVLLGPAQQHVVTLALSPADGSWRPRESGLLQQVLLLLAAVPAGSPDAAALRAVHGAATASVAAPAAGTRSSAGYLVFVVARRVTVCLVRSVRDVASCLDVEAKPYVPDWLHRLFGTPPQHAFPVHSQRLPAPADEPGWWPAACNEVGLAVGRLHEPAAQALPAGDLAANKYSRLMALEEGAMEVDIARHDMFNTRLRFAVFAEGARRHRYLLCGVGEAAAGPPAQYRGPSLPQVMAEHSGPSRASSETAETYVLGSIEVPGILEARPAVLTGDRVYLRSARAPGVEYATLVASVEGTRCLLLLPPEFWAAMDLEPPGADGAALKANQFFDGLAHVRFSFDRKPFEYMHAALAAVPRLLEARGCTLLPGAGADAADSEWQPQSEEVARIAASLKERGAQRLNAEQRQAVAAVLAGTGKTVTLVECALQLLARYPSARLLMAAPQNYSADLLASALGAAGLGPADLLRLNSPKRPRYTVKDDVLPFTEATWDERLRLYAPPTPEALRSRRVVVATCAAAGMLQGGELRRGGGRPAFSHVLVDEAGQALLPEALVALSLLTPQPPAGAAHRPRGPSDPGWGAALCGDPRQLGPVVRSPAAAAAGLARSLLEEWADAHALAAPAVLHQGRAPALSMLVRNYRSHSRLLGLPSKLFYSGSLLAAAEPNSVLPPSWDELRIETAASSPDDGAPGGPEAASAAGDAAAEADAEGESGAGSPGAEGEEGDSSGGFDESAVASLLFYGVRGQQAREGDSPSYHNPLEASIVADLVSGLLAAAPGVVPSDIGVMATYRTQVQKVRLLLRQRGLAAIRVGTVDDFQGQEQRIVFISTVLSRPETLPPRPAGGDAPAGDGHAPAQAGADTHMGFWRNPRRFNVAITRAKALLVVVGHPAVLLEDASWRELLRYCLSHGVYRGAGADAIERRFRVDVSGAAPVLPLAASDGRGALGAGQGQGEADDEADLQATICQLAELALLGAGDADRLFPDSLEEMYDAYADEAQWRIML